MGVSLNPASILSGQGIDVSSVVQQIISEQSGPLSVWQQQQTTIASQNGELDGINNDLANLQTAIQALADPAGAFAAQTATTSQPGVVTATANGTAIAGTHQIVVTSLATTGTLYTDPVTGGANVSFLPTGATGGNIQLQVGGVNGTTDNIAITAGSNDTLATLADYINTQSTANNWGVTASVVSDASGSRLALQSQNSGSAGALSLTSNTNTILTFDTPVGGANAVLGIDGVPFSSSNDTVTGAIQGVTLNLVSQSPGNPVQLTVAPDASQVSSAVTNFISAYNTLISDINAQYAVDPTGATPAPPLESDVSLRSVQSSILNDGQFSITGNSGYVNLESLGINTANNGTLSLGLNAQGQTFAQVLAANPSAVQNFFQNSTGTGFANTFNTDLTTLTDPTSGPLNAELTQNNAENQDLTNSITNLQTQLTAQTTALTQQFDSVNASLQAYPLLLQEITETLGTLGSGTSASGSLISSEPTLTSGL
jgi:flagellar hook-associated protein 2